VTKINPVKSPMDENYDGYYDDRLPDDAELMKENESMDPEVMKQVVLIAGGAFLFVSLMVALLTLRI